MFVEEFAGDVELWEVAVVEPVVADDDEVGLFVFDEVAAGTVVRSDVLDVFRCGEDLEALVVREDRRSAFVAFDELVGVEPDGERAVCCGTCEEPGVAVVEEVEGSEGEDFHAACA